MNAFGPIIDSSLSLKEALGERDIPLGIKETLTIIEVTYISFDDLLHQGQILLHRNVATEIQEIFMELCALRFPIQQAIPIIKYDWDDETSMSANNTSAFNYREIHGTNQISNHARGLAIDINPLLNPCQAIDGTIQPATAIYDPSRPGTIKPDDEIVFLFTSRGWRWLGYRERKDWQHFDKASAA